MEKRNNLELQVQTLKDLRQLIGMNRTQYSEYMGIPLRTLEEWEAGRRKMPDYVLRLMVYYTKMEQLIKERRIELGEDTDNEN